MSTTTLSQRLKHVLDVMDWTEADLTRAVGAPQQSTVQHWISGRNKRMQSRFAWPLQDNYRWSARWILDGEGPERIPERIRVTDGILVNEVAAELDNLTGVCHAAADSSEERYKTKALYAVAFALETLNSKLSEIGDRLPINIRTIERRIVDPAKDENDD